MKRTHLMMISKKKAFIFSNQITIYLSCSNTCLSNIYSMKMCFFLLSRIGFSYKEEKQIQQSQEMSKPLHLYFYPLICIFI